MSAQHQEGLTNQTIIFAQLLAQLEDSSRRFSRLELDALEIEKLVLTDVDKQEELYKNSVREADKLNKSLEDFKKELTFMGMKVREISLSFRELIKQEAVDELESQIDNWPLEQFITRKEFSKLLEQEENQTRKE